jgi:hypothetical protein
MSVKYVSRNISLKKIVYHINKIRENSFIDQVAFRENTFGKIGLLIK